MNINLNDAHDAALRFLQGLYNYMNEKYSSELEGVILNAFVEGAKYCAKQSDIDIDKDKEMIILTFPDLIDYCKEQIDRISMGDYVQGQNQAYQNMINKIKELTKEEDI